MSLDGRKDDEVSKDNNRSNSMQQSGQEIRQTLAQHQPPQQQFVPPLCNPYSVKRSRTPKVNLPLYESVDGVISLRTASIEPLASSCTASNDITTKTSVEDADTKISAARAPMIEPNATTIGVGTQPVISFSTSDPRWKRLPSRNVTFGSGEILTVTELLQHGHDFRDRSVRVTGVLQHRHVHANYAAQDEVTPSGKTVLSTDGLSPNVILVSLVLTDPLVPTHKKKKKRPRSSIISARRISFGKSPMSTSSSSLDASSNNTSFTNEATSSSRTPSVKLHHQPTTATTTTTTTITPGPFKTPAAKGVNSNSLLLRSSYTPSTTPRFVGFKRPLAVATTSSSRTVGVDALVDDLAEQLGIWIVVNPQHVDINDCAVGDLVMVIGEVRTMHDGESDLMIGPNHEIRNMHKELVERGQHQQHQQQQDGTNTVFHVQARIVKNVNGTNMALQHEALLLRRKTARAAWSANTDKNDASDSLLRPGCGPPDFILNNSKDVDNNNNNIR